MLRILRKKSALAVFLLLISPAVCLGARIKDIARLEGVRNNPLVGYGLVVGLNGTGDSAGTEFTVQSLVNMIERLGVNVDKSKVKVNNVAAVIVTAELPPFAKTGNAIDVLVSSVGDSKSLVGGSLLMTPLKGPDGRVYAVAQGALAVGAIAFGGKAATVQKNHPTVGRIPNGALVEREVPFALRGGEKLPYRLMQADFTTASRMAAAINRHFSQDLAQTVDSGSLTVFIPLDYRDRLIDFIAEVEGLNVKPDAMARIVVNERTGTIVMGEDVRVSTVAVSHANLNLVIKETSVVSQPNPLGGGDTAVVPDTGIQVTEEKSNLVVMNMGVSIGDVASALNAIGATPRDLIAIFQAIKAAGALHAELVVL